MARSPLEQEYYEQFVAEGLDELTADIIAREWATEDAERLESGEY